MGKGARFWQGRRTHAVIKTISLVLLPWFWWIVFFKLSIVWQMWYISVVRVGVTRSSRDNSNQHLSECVPAPAKSMTHYSCIWCQTNLYYVFTAKQWHPGCFHWNWMFVFFLTFRFIYFFFNKQRYKGQQSQEQTASIKLATVSAPVFHWPWNADAINNSHGECSVITLTHHYQKSVNGIIRTLC